MHIFLYIKYKIILCYTKVILLNFVHFYQEKLTFPFENYLDFVHGCKSMTAVQLILELSHFLDSLGVYSYVL